MATRIPTMSPPLIPEQGRLQHALPTCHCFTLQLRFHFLPLQISKPYCLGSIHLAPLRSDSPIDGRKHPRTNKRHSGGALGNLVVSSHVTDSLLKAHTCHPSPSCVSLFLFLSPLLSPLIRHCAPLHLCPGQTAYERLHFYTCTSVNW